MTNKISPFNSEWGYFWLLRAGEYIGDDLHHLGITARTRYIDDTIRESETLITRRSGRLGRIEPDSDWRRIERCDIGLSPPYRHRVHRTIACSISTIPWILRERESIVQSSILIDVELPYITIIYIWRSWYHFDSYSSRLCTVYYSWCSALALSLVCDDRLGRVSHTPITIGLRVCTTHRGIFHRTHSPCRRNRSLCTWSVYIDLLYRGSMDPLRRYREQYLRSHEEYEYRESTDHEITIPPCTRCFARCCHKWRS